MTIFSKAFLEATAERAVKTFLQTVGATITVAGVGAALGDVDWKAAASVGAVSAIYSLITSVISSRVGDNGGPSAVSAEKLNPAA